MNINRWLVDVAVANVWTRPESPRIVDQRVLSNPAEVKEWLSQMSFEDRLALCSDNLLQTQVLYGQTVIAIEEREEWLHVVIPEQPSSKDKRGYPGWMLKRQLRQVTHADEVVNETFVAVSTATAYLFPDKQTKGMEISFQTRLSLIGEADHWCVVLTPSGAQFIKREDVQILPFQEQRSNKTEVGKAIVASGEMFLGLPYLWGGMSGFGFDCSGFAYTMHRAHGITIPRDASDQSQKGTAVERADLLPGDLLFFAYEQGKGFVHHVGIYYGNDRMIHAPKTGKTVEIIDLPNSSYEEEYWGARRYW